MSSSSSILCEELFQCYVCLDVFTEPVSIPCGHSFCLACVRGHWEASGTSQCPKCSRAFPGMPELCENAFAREMAEQIRLKRSGGVTERRAAAPGEVSCDVCIGRKLRAVRSCLVCLASYCEEHLVSHGNRFTKHALAAPVERLEDRMCRKHERLLELFCRYDQTCVCVLCTDTDHRTHHTVSVEREWALRKTQLAATLAQMQQMTQERLKKAKEIKHSVELSRKNTDKEMADSIEVFTALVRSIERSQAQLLEVMEEKQRAAERQAGGFLEELEQEITELKRRNAELEQLSHTEDHLHLLQSFPSLCSPGHSKDWSKISVHAVQCVGLLRGAVSQLQELLADQVNTLSEKELEKIMQYSVDLTLDPGTANPWLLLSADGKQVVDGDVERKVPDGAERFDTAPCVLAREPISRGRSYWEVEVANKTAWDLGVVRESISRKGVVTLIPEDGYWAVCLRTGSEYRACAGHSVVLPLRLKPQRVGVYVDYEEGRVSFYDVGACTHIYSFSGVTFTGRLLPLFNPEMNDSGNNNAPLVICPVRPTNGGGTCDDVTI